MDIETLATMEVKMTLAALPRVRSFINERDKEPSWDGNIYLYSDENCNKKGITKLSAQVKGCEANGNNLQEISYPIEVADLENYYHNGGCLYFVVYISPQNSQDKVIFYRALLPYDLREILNGKEKQKTISVKMQRFPNKKIEILNTLLHFAHHAAFQASYHTISDENLAKARDLSKGNASLSFSYNFVGENIFDVIFDTPTYEYRDSEFGQKIPINNDARLYAIEFEKNAPISCNGKVYFNSFRACRKQNIQEIKIGCGILISINETEKKQVISYTPNGTLEQQITDIEFYHAVMHARELMLGNIIINIPFLSLSVEEIQARKEKLEYLKTLRQAFIEAGHKGNVNINDFTDEDWKNGRVLINTFIDKASCFKKSRDGVSFFCFTIGNTSLLLLNSQNGANNRVYNPYNTQLRAEMEYGNKKIPVSHFCFLNEEELKKVSCFDFDAVLKNVKSYPLCSNYLEQLNELLLKMLRAYDSGSNDPNMLHYCEKFANWLLEHDIAPHIGKLNLYQIYKRKRPLNSDEISVLHKLLEEVTTLAFQKVGVYILLSDWRNFTKQFNKLPIEQKKYFMTFPIFNLVPENIRAKI